MTPVFCCGFECGATAAHWNVTATAAFDTTIKRSGARSMKFTGTSSACTLVPALSGSVGVARFYVYFVTFPSGAVADIFGFFSGSSLRGKVVFDTDNKLYARSSGTNGATGFSVDLNRWYCVDILVNVTNNPWTCDVKVDGVSLGQSTNGVAGSTLTTAKFSENALNGEFYVDDVCISQTSGDYPIGAGYVNHFVPTSDGTHTATTTTIVKGTIAAPTAGGNVAGATDVFNWVNGVPLLGGATDNTRLVNQQTAGTTLYAECIFGPAPGIKTPLVAPRAVDVVTADREATTASCDFTAKLNDNGTENTIIARGVVAGVTSDRYANKHYATAPTGGAWTVIAGAGNFNNIRARWGYASDATPDLYWRGIMIEAEFKEILFKGIQVNQSVKRASTY